MATKSEHPFRGCAVHDRAPIRADFAAGMRVSDIARSRGVSRTTVYAALDESRPARYERRGPLDEWDAPIRETLYRYPRMTAVDVRRRLRYRGPLRQFSEHVRRVRREVLYEAARQA